MGEETPTQVWLPVRIALRKLAAANVVHGLDDGALDRLRRECWDDNEEAMEDAGVLGVLTAYYENQGAARRDGFLWHVTEFWQETEDLVAELASLLGEPPIFRQEKAHVRSHKCTIDLLRDDGQRRTVEVRS